ncbi:mycothiol synthase [Nocardioidaceae bacterium]|nr:mycothiol synthase [Nocardioidaceae bacterium]
MSSTGSHLEHVRRLAERATAHDGTAPFDEAVLLQLERDGLPEQLSSVDQHAAAWVTHDEHGGADLHLVVDPDVRGEGVGSARTAILLDEVTATVRAWSHGDHPAARALAERHHFARARALWVMRRGIEHLPSLADLRESPGVRLRHLGSEESAGGPTREDDRDAVLTINAAAFADHPEQGALDVDGFEQRADSDWFDPRGLLLAVEEESGEVLGFHWTKLDPGAGNDGEIPGEIYVLGIAPAAQGRGLGTLLSLAGLHHMVDAGASELLLYVEGDNAAAIRTYEKLGFTHADLDTHVQYVREARGS